MHWVQKNLPLRRAPCPQTHIPQQAGLQQGRHSPCYYTHCTQRCLSEEPLQQLLYTTSSFGVPFTPLATTSSRLVAKKSFEPPAATLVSESFEFPALFASMLSSELAGRDLCCTPKASSKVAPHSMGVTKALVAAACADRRGRARPPFVLQRQAANSTLSELSVFLCAPHTTTAADVLWHCC